VAERSPHTSAGNSREQPRAGADAIDYGPLAHWVGFNLRMAQDASFQAFSRLSREIGVKPGRFATLLLIGNNPGISQTTLSRANGRDKSTLTPLLADLVRRGLVRRTRTPNDRRSYRLTLTRAGEALLRLSARARARNSSAPCASLPPRWSERLSRMRCSAPPQSSASFPHVPARCTADPGSHKTWWFGDPVSAPHHPRVAPRRKTMLAR
jgi:DNA-binding MarR family transcriptional regulator